MADMILTDPRRQRWLLANSALGAFIIFLDSYIVNVSLPTVARFFGVGTSAVSGVTLAYLLVLTATLLIFGRLADRVGMKRVYMAGYACFTLGSLFCGLSPTLPALIASRCVQGLGGAMMFSVGPVLVPRYLPASMRGSAFGLVITAGALGMTLGAPLGGFITGFVGWKWIFLVNVPIGVAAMVMAGRVLPSDADSKPAPVAPFDLVGSILSFSFMLALVFGLNQGEEMGWGSPAILACLAASVVFGLLFLFRERRVRSPLLDLAIFRDPSIAAAGWVNLLGFMVTAGGNFLLPFYLTGVEGLRPEHTGLVLLTYSVVYASLSPLMGRLSDRHPPRILCCAGMLSAAGACLFFSFALDTRGLWPTLAFLAWLGVSYAMFISPLNNLIMGLAPAEELGEVSGVFKTLTNLSFVLGVTAFEALFSLGIPGGLIHDAVPAADIVLGLRRALVFGAAVCCIAFVFNARIRPAANPPAL